MNYALIFIFIFPVSALAGDYDQAVKYCHEQSLRLPNIWELKYLWKTKKLSPGHSFWSSTCATQRSAGKGWDYYQGNCERLAILDSQGHVQPKEPSFPEIKDFLCVKSRG
ncbi:MAG: hypothetical protein WCK49_04865 [Myxococcaceae bacterium]